MDSTVTIRRRGEQVLDEQTGRYTTSWAVIYVGPARIRFGTSEPTEVDAAGQRGAEQSPTVALPIGEHPLIQFGASADVRVDDEGRIESNPDDPGSVGTQFRVAGTHTQTHSTARRLPVEVTSHA